MEVIISSSSATRLKLSSKLTYKPHKPTYGTPISFPITTKYPNSNSNSNSNSNYSSPPTPQISISTPSATIENENQRHWMVVMDTPPQNLHSKRDLINYYVQTLNKIFKNEKEAQRCIYDVSTDIHFGFCCDIHPEKALNLAGLPGVLSVRLDSDFDSLEKDYSFSKVQLSDQSTSYTSSSLFLFPEGTSKHWLVQMDKPAIGVLTKTQMVDYYVQVLTKVLRNEKDAQMCIYHVSWQSNFGFCCELDDEGARELAGVPGVLSVQPDENFDSDNKDYGGENLQHSGNSPDSPEENQPPTNVKTKKLFVTGLSFYTSEKTLRAAFEPFGELVEVRIIMDKISKRSKGYAFIEYKTEEAAGAALKEMNGKIINGWMIVVDVAKTNPVKYNRGRPIPAM